MFTIPSLFISTYLLDLGAAIALLAAIRLSVMLTRVKGFLIVAGGSYHHGTFLGPDNSLKCVV